jgi:syntaxin-binding protein 1
MQNQANGDRDTKKLKFKSSSDDGEEEYELSRYKPVVHHVLTEHIKGKLDQSAFPYVRDAPTGFSQGLTAQTGSSNSVSSRLTSAARGQKTFGGGISSAPSLRSAKPAANRPSRPGLDGGVGSFGSTRSGGSAVSEREPIRQRVIMFVAGGITYSEMRTAYQVGAKLQRDVYIGAFFMRLFFRSSLCSVFALVMSYLRI